MSNRSVNRGLVVVAVGVLAASAVAISIGHDRPSTGSAFGVALAAQGAAAQTTTRFAPRWPQWSAIAVAEGRIGSIPYRLGVSTRIGPALASDLPGGGKSSATLLLQTVDPAGRIRSTEQVVNDTSQAMSAPITFRTVPIDSQHEVLFGLTVVAMSRLTYTPAHGRAAEVAPSAPIGASGFRWFLTQVPSGPARLVGYGTAGTPSIVLVWPGTGLASH